MRAAVWLACAACSAGGGPHLGSVAPAAVARGEMATVTGEALCGSSGDCAHTGGQLQIGIDPPVVQAVIVSLSETSMTFAVPTVAPIGRTSLVATIDGQSSNALDFEVLP